MTERQESGPTLEDLHDFELRVGSMIKTGEAIELTKIGEKGVTVVNVRNLQEYLEKGYELTKYSAMRVGSVLLEDQETNEKRRAILHNNEIKSLLKLLREGWQIVFE